MLEHNYKPGAHVHGFMIEKNDLLTEIDGRALEAKHQVSGARLLVLHNDDNNKAFSIAFCTSPKDDTGVFHILEHSVLCGSKSFPVKEPFVNLLTSSMQTFLNAMTFADKTMYPVASTNEQDLFNLMDVYLDAVFHPNIYINRSIFEQEGWHLELSDKAGEPSGEQPGEQARAQKLSYNGVVYNEMKGVLSDTNAVLYNEVQAQLFPGTCYAYESGGKPECIPTLSYEAFLDEHARHYRTENSYIVLYGNLDVDRALAFLDERYLSPVAQEQKQRDLKREEAGLEPLLPRALQEVCEGARVSGAGDARDAGQLVRKEMATTPENACAACAFVLKGKRDKVRTVALEILVDALFGSNEAPLKRVLLDEGFAHDVHAFSSDSLLQPFVFVQLHLPAPDAAQSLRRFLAKAVRQLLDRGLNKELLEASLSHAEFVMREHDMGEPDGVVDAIMALSGWLYDENAATDYLRYESIFKELRDLLQTDYFERLAQEIFCENSHVASVEIIPVQEGENEEDKRLEKLQASLTDKDLKRISRSVEDLRSFQERPDSPEALASLPRLLLEDIGSSPADSSYELDPQAPITCMRHHVSTHGIVYAYRYFDLSSVEFEEMPYVTVLALLLGRLATQHHTAEEIDTLVQSKLGNLTFYSEIFEDSNDIAHITPRFVVSTSALATQADWLDALPREIMLESDFSDTEKIFEIFKQRKIGMEHAFIVSGHSCAIGRLKSYYAPAGVLREQLGNVDFYHFLCHLIDNFSDYAPSLPMRLHKLAVRLFNDERCIVSFAGPDEAYQHFWSGFAGRQSRADASVERTEEPSCALVVPSPKVRNEAFIVPSDVSFTAAGWDRRLIKADPALTKQTGDWLVASQALSYDYLWGEVRLKGGAYGAGFRTARSGNMRFYSYRDPHLDQTLACFKEAASWLEAYEPTREAFEGFVVSSVAALDTPCKPRQLIKRQMGEYFSGCPANILLQRREEVFATTPQSLRDRAEVLQAALQEGAVCSFGSRALLENTSVSLQPKELVGTIG